MGSRDGAEIRKEITLTKGFHDCGLDGYPKRYPTQVFLLLPETSKPTELEVLKAHLLMMKAGLLRKSVVRCCVSLCSGRIGSL
jgi:hypothetical protein